MFFRQPATQNIFSCHKWYHFLSVSLEFNLHNTCHKNNGEVWLWTGLIYLQQHNQDLRGMNSSSFFTRMHCTTNNSNKNTRWVRAQAAQTECVSIECFHSRRQHLCKFIGTKESVCIRKEFSCQRISLGAVSLFWDTHMAAVTSCENTLFNITVFTWTKWDESSKLPWTKIVQKSQYDKTKVRYL